MTTDVDVLQEMFASGVITLASDFVMVIWIVGSNVVSRRQVGAGLAGVDPADGLGDQFFSAASAPHLSPDRVRIARINAYLGEAFPHGGDPTICPRGKNYRELRLLTPIIATPIIYRII